MSYVYPPFSTVQGPPLILSPPTIIPPLPPSLNHLDSLPQPSPPAGWVIIHGSTTVKQDFTSVEVTYEYKYGPPGKEYKTLPVQINPPPAVPAYWSVTKSTFTVEKEEKAHLYKYILKYSEPPAAPKPDAKK